MSDVTSTSTTSERQDFRSHIGKDANFKGQPLGVTLRRFTLMRRMWKFSEEELGWVTAVFLRKCTAKYLLDLHNLDHDWKDRVEFQNKLYDLEFIDMSMETLKELVKEAPNTELMISIRENTEEDFYVFLVKLKDSRDRGYMKDLDTSRNREQKVA